MSKKINKDKVLELIAKMMNEQHDICASLDATISAAVSKNIIDKETADSVMRKSQETRKIKIDLLDIIHSEVRIL